MEIYLSRGQRLIRKIGKGMILLPGNMDLFGSFKANIHPFV